MRALNRTAILSFLALALMLGAIVLWTTVRLRTANLAQRIQTQLAAMPFEKTKDPALKKISSMVEDALKETTP